jgi:hypothetical protein
MAALGGKNANADGFSSREILGKGEAFSEKQLSKRDICMLNS